MTDDDITKLATEAGFNFSPMPNMLFTVRGNHAQLVKFATLATQAERESRQAAQAENEQLKARLARSGVELRAAVRAESKECEKAIRAVDALHAAGLVDMVLDAIRAHKHIVDANKLVEDPTVRSAS